MADEAYTLVVEPNSILLQASSEAGLFYAKEALLQKKSMQEHRNAEAQLARAISRLRTKEHWNSRR